MVKRRNRVCTPKIPTAIVLGHTRSGRSPSTQRNQIENPLRVPRAHIIRSSEGREPAAGATRCPCFSAGRLKAKLRRHPLGVRRDAGGESIRRLPLFMLPLFVMSRKAKSSLQQRNLVSAGGTCMRRGRQAIYNGILNEENHYVLFCVCAVIPLSLSLRGLVLVASTIP